MKGSCKVAILVVAWALCSAALGLQPHPAEAGGKPEKLIYASIPDMTGPYAAIVGPAQAAFADAVQTSTRRAASGGSPWKPWCETAAARWTLGSTSTCSIGR